MNPTEQKILILISIFAVSATVIPFASDPVSIGSAQNYLCGINVLGSNLVSCTQPNDNFTFTHGSGIQMKSFQANKTIWLNASSTGGGSGEVNTASNLAGTLNWFASKVGVDLQFRGLNLGTGLTGSQTTTTITLDTILRINNGTCPVGYVMNGNNNVTGARNCILDTSGTGTYSQVLANNVVKNSGGTGLNFLNGTNNPLNIVNDPTRNQVNITVNVPSSSADNDPAPKVSINTLNRSSFINIMQTNSSVISDLTDVAGGGTTGQVLTKASNGTWIAQNNVHGVTAGAGTTVNGTTNTVSVSANVHAVQAGSGVSVNGTTGTIVVSSSASGVVTLLSSNQTCTSTTNFCHVWNIPMSANTGNSISGVLIASTNTAGGAVQVGANMSNTHGQGSCTFNYDSAGTTLTTFSSVLTTVSSDSAWTTILAGANQPYPINFYCSIDTDGTATTLQINFQAEVSSTVSIKANSFYQKTP